MGANGWSQRSVERAAAAAFRRVFEIEPVLAARAPGRVILVGEHVGDPEGLVLSVAMEQEVQIAARPTDGSRVRLVSAQRDERVEFDAAQLEPGSQPDWARPVVEAAAALCRAGHELRGFDGVVAGNIPSSLGLAASTALGVAAAVLFRAISELDLEDRALAEFGARSGEEPVDGAAGRVDALTALVAEAGRAVWVDGRDLSFRWVPLPPALRIVVLDSGLRRPPARDEYARRRHECEAAVAAIREHDPETSSLRDITPEETARWEARLPPALAKRVRHVVGENERVKLAAAALEQNETERFGELLFASHRSLRDDYEVSAPELDALVELARGAPGVVGARMTSSGFGCCTVNVVAAAWVDEFIERVQHRYHERCGIRPEAYVTAAGPGANVAKAARG